MDLGFWSHGELLQFLFWTCLPYLCLFLLAEAVPASSVPHIPRKGSEVVREVAQVACGMALAVFLVIVLAKLGATMHDCAFNTWKEGIYPAINHFSKKLGQSDTNFFTEERKNRVVVIYSMFPFVSGLSYVAFAALFRRLKSWELSPGFAIAGSWAS